MELAANLYLFGLICDAGEVLLEEFEYNENRKQYDASKVLVGLAKIGKPEWVDYSLYIMGEVAYIAYLNFAFGVALKSQGKALLSIYRLRQGAGPKLLEGRVFKEATREIGYLFGLDRCTNPKCLVSSPNYPSTSTKLPNLCKDCMKMAGLV